MEEHDASGATKVRISIINTVQTPLGFFVLVVLAVEAMLLVIVTRLGEGRDRTVFIAGMLVIIVALIVVVARMDPKVLTGSPNKAEDTSVPNKKRSKIEGTYLAEGSRNYVIVISHLSENLHQLRAETASKKNVLWEGVGIFDGESYFGVYKYIDNPESEVSGNWGAHRVRVREGGGILKLHQIELGNEWVEIEYEYTWVRDTDRV